MFIKFIIPIAIMYIGSIVVPANNWPSFILEVALYTIIYAAFAYIFVINHEEKDQIKSVQNKLLKKKRAN